MKTVIVIPGYNEEKYLGTVLRKVQKFGKHIVYVDDGSRDTSAEIAKKVIKHVLIHEVNLGKGAAMRTGAEYAFSHLGADAIIFLDSDDQHDPAEIPRFVKEFEQGNDIVFGVRTPGPDMPLVRFLGNKTASVFLRLLFGQYIPDIPSGYKGLTKKAYKKVRWQSSGYEVEAEIAAKTARYRLPFSILVIESIYHDTDKGMNLLDAFWIALRLLQWRLEI